MIKKNMLFLFVLFVSLSFSLPAAAFQGKVTGIDEKVVTLSADTPLPAWVKKGALAETSSGLAKVEMVDGQKFELKVKKSAAANLKAGDTLEVNPKSAGGGKKLQGC